jgi:hypothetical protein
MTLEQYHDHICISSETLLINRPLLSLVAVMLALPVPNGSVNWGILARLP